MKLSFLICAVILAAGSAHADAGSLDPAFGQGGKVIASFGSPIVVANAALQADGKIVVLLSNNQSNFAVARFLSDGSVDTSFGAGGFSQAIFADFNLPHSVSIQSDGTILATGVASNDNVHFEFAAARFNGDGSLDSTFGTGGQATAPVAGALSQSVSVIQPDGKILVAGPAIINFRLPNNLAMVRFNPDGSLDSTFGINGSVEQGSTAAFASSLGLDSAGNIFVVAGRAIAQFTPNGRSKALATAAIVASSHGGTPLATAFQPNAEYVFAEGIFEGVARQRDADTKVVRFTASGSVDQTFNSPTFDFVGEGGTFTSDITTAITVLPNGKILLGASHSVSGFSDGAFDLARLNADGSRDPRFGENGIVTTTNVGAVEGITALLVQPDGNMIAVGTANSFADVALVRFLGQ